MYIKKKAITVFYQINFFMRIICLHFCHLQFFQCRRIDCDKIGWIKIFLFRGKVTFSNCPFSPYQFLPLHNFTIKNFVSVPPFLPKKSQRRYLKKQNKKVENLLMYKKMCDVNERRKVVNNFAKRKWILMIMKRNLHVIKKVDKSFLFRLRLFLQELSLFINWFLKIRAD